MTGEERAQEDNELQNPLVHEGAPADGLDTNEVGDEKVSVVQPSGEPIR